MSENEYTSDHENNCNPLEQNGKSFEENVLCSINTNMQSIMERILAYLEEKQAQKLLMIHRERHKVSKLHIIRGSSLLLSLNPIPP